MQDLPVFVQHVQTVGQRRVGGVLRGKQKVQHGPRHVVVVAVHGGPLDGPRLVNGQTPVLQHAARLVAGFNVGPRLRHDALDGFFDAILGLNGAGQTEIQVGKGKREKAHGKGDNVLFEMGAILVGQVGSQKGLLTAGRRHGAKGNAHVQRLSRAFALVLEFLQVAPADLFLRLGVLHQRLLAKEGGRQNGPELLVRFRVHVDEVARSKQPEGVGVRKDLKDALGRHDLAAEFRVGDEHHERAAENVGAQALAAFHGDGGQFGPEAHRVDDHGDQTHERQRVGHPRHVASGVVVARGVHAHQAAEQFYHGAVRCG